MNPEDVARYLADHPAFFEQHPQVLTQMQLPHSQGSAVSLMERQAQMQRERIRALEARLAELARYSSSTSALSRSARASSGSAACPASDTA